MWCWWYFSSSFLNTLTQIFSWIRWSVRNWFGIEMLQDYVADNTLVFVVTEFAKMEELWNEEGIVYFVKLALKEKNRYHWQCWRRVPFHFRITAISFITGSAAAAALQLQEIFHILNAMNFPMKTQFYYLFLGLLVLQLKSWCICWSASQCVELHLKVIEKNLRNVM